MRKYLVLIILISYGVNSMAQSILEINIDNFKSDNGLLFFELMDENEVPIRSIKEKVINHKSRVLIKDLKPGKYLFRYFHDKNSNDKLDTNWVGMPTEGFGFSNNAKGRFGPPPLEKMIFDFKDTKLLQCSLMYLSR